MFVLLQTYVSSSPSSLCRWRLRRSWYPYWWWLWSFVHEGHGHTCCLSSTGRQPVANELQDVWWAVGACGECTVYRGCTLHCCYRHRTMAVDRRHSTYSFQFASCADLVNFRSRPNMSRYDDHNWSLDHVSGRTEHKSISPVHHWTPLIPALWWRCTHSFLHADLQRHSSVHQHRQGWCDARSTFWRQTISFAPGPLKPACELSVLGCSVFFPVLHQPTQRQGHQLILLAHHGVHHFQTGGQLQQRNLELHGMSPCYRIANRQALIHVEHV